MTKYKITNKTGMLVSYAKIEFAPKETKILDLDSVYEHEYFIVEKLGKIKKKSKKLNEELEKSEKN